MASILHYLQNIFASLFSLDTREIELRRNLREIYHRLTVSGLNYYDRSSKQIQPAFAAALEEFIRFLQPLIDILTKTVCNTDHHLAERYRSYLVVSRLPAAKQEQLVSFTYDGMKQQLEQADEPRQKLNEISALFHAFIKVFSSPPFDGFDQEYAEFSHLVNICNHRYQDLLALFDTTPRSAMTGMNRSYRPVAGEKAVHHLLDIYFILADFQFSEGITKNVGALIDRLERDHAAETHALVNRCMLRLERLLKQSLQPEILLMLIRLIKKDPECSPEVCCERLNLLDSYVVALTAHFERDRARIEREINETAVDAELARLFPVGTMVEVKSYDNKTAARLLATGFETFTLVKPLMILKNFNQFHYRNRLQEPLKKILVEGYFEKKNFQNIFSSTFYACEEIQESVAAFELEISGSGGKSDGFSVVRIRNYLELHDRGKDVERLLNEQVEGINQRALLLLEAGISAYYNLGTLLEEILVDMKLKNPLTVSNLRALMGKQYHSFTELLEAGAGSLSLLLKLLRSFAVLQTASPPPEQLTPGNESPAAF
jgi:hypothetical protein